MSKETKSIAKSISVLSIAGIICKVIGVLFSIPLNMISPKVAMLFYLVYPTYTLLLTVSSAGLPVAISRMIAGYLARKQASNARKTFATALMLLFSIGAMFSLIMVLTNTALTNMVGVKEASQGFYAISPCVMIVCILSAFRGYFQGHQNMVPTAVSQVIEQVGKVILSLPLAVIGLKRDVAHGAAGALLGITIAESIALVFMIIRYYRRKEVEEKGNSDVTAARRSDLIKTLTLISIPITISACISPLSQFIDSAMMIKRMLLAGLTQAEAEASYGIFTSIVIRLINIPTALALAISMSLVPAISACKSINDTEGIRKESHTGIRYAALIGFPCSVGMSVLAKEIVLFIYGNVSKFTSANLHLASELLTFSAMTVVLFTGVQATSSILQGLRRQKIPMYTMIAGVAIKIVLNYFLIGTKGIDIHGGPYASIACYLTVLILNLIYVCKYAELKFDIVRWVVKPGLAAAAMGLAVYIMKTVLPAGRLVTILEIVVGIAVYLGAAILLKALTKEDLASLRRKKV